MPMPRFFGSGMDSLRTGIHEHWTKMPGLRHKYKSTYTGGKLAGVASLGVASLLKRKLASSAVGK